MRDRGKQEKFSCIYKVVRAWRLTNSRHFHQVQLFHQFNSTPVVSGHENLTTIISCVERPLEFANLADILKPFSEKNKAGSNKVSKGSFAKRRHPILFLFFYEILLIFVFPICFHKKKSKYLARCFFAQFSIVICFLSVKPLEWKHYLELFSAALCYYNKG